jgi:DNA-binding response OmpR family regulator
MKRKKILLADDSATVLMMEKMILASGPYDLLVARDGQEAVEKAIAEKPDLVLLDVVMPRMDGFQALARLRAEETTRRLPVILVTTRGEEDNVAIGYKAGCTAYLTKPLDGPELLAAVKACLGAEV